MSDYCGSCGEPTPDICAGYQDCNQHQGLPEESEVSRLRRQVRELQMQLIEERMMAALSHDAGDAIYNDSEAAIWRNRLWDRYHAGTLPPWFDRVMRTLYRPTMRPSLPDLRPTAEDMKKEVE